MRLRDYRYPVTPNHPPPGYERPPRQHPQTSRVRLEPAPVKLTKEVWPPYWRTGGGGTAPTGLLDGITSEDRKVYPLAEGVLDYFPDALLAVAECSFIGSQQQHPGKPMHWDRTRNSGHASCLLRHLIQRGTRDTDGVLHSAKVAWRALANLQVEIEKGAARKGVALQPGV